MFACVYVCVCVRMCVYCEILLCIIFSIFVVCQFLKVQYKHEKRKKKFCYGAEKQEDLRPVSQRVAINRTMDINRRSMANRVLRKLAINRNPF